MNKIKQEKGITLVILAVIIIALMILAGVSINMGRIDIDSTVDSKLEGELKMVQYAVFQQYAKYKTTLDKSSIIEGSKTYSNAEITNFMKENYNSTNPVYAVKENDEIYKKYYLLTPEDLIEIGIQDSKYSYIVNYYTGEVMNADKFKTSSGNLLYIRSIDSIKESESF